MNAFVASSYHHVLSSPDIWPLSPARPAYTWSVRAQHPWRMRWSCQRHGHLVAAVRIIRSAATLILAELSNVVLQLAAAVASAHGNLVDVFVARCPQEHLSLLGNLEALLPPLVLRAIGEQMRQAVLPLVVMQRAVEPPFTSQNMTKIRWCGPSMSRSAHGPMWGFHGRAAPVENCDGARQCWW